MMGGGSGQNGARRRANAGLSGTRDGYNNRPKPDFSIRVDMSKAKISKKRNRRFGHPKTF